MDKIYSRARIKLPKFNNYSRLPNGKNLKSINKLGRITCIIIIAILTANFIMQAIYPIIDKQCINTAKMIATKISNEQATKVMSKYKYDDLCTVTKDTNGNIAMISANVVPINEIISDIAIKIQEELNKKENSSFKISMGSFLGTKLFSGRGPKLEVKMSTIGNLDTDLKSEFIDSGINQTLHKIYLQVECEVSILTPFNTIDEKITNQVLLAEAVIIGTTPNTYYNFEGISQKEVLEIIE